MEKLYDLKFALSMYFLSTHVICSIINDFPSEYMVDKSY